MTDGYKPLAESEYDRNITFNKGISEEKTIFASNQVVSSSYTWWNFIPKNTWEQMQSVSNIYFLLIGLLQAIRAISVTGGTPDIWPVLFGVMLISMIRAGLEDYQKHKADKRRNADKYIIFSENGWIDVKSGDIKVGNIIKVTRDKIIPADLLLLNSSLEKNQIFLDRANINGETRLEVMNALPETIRYVDPSAASNKRYKGKQTLADFSATLRYEKPNKSFDKFNGKLEIGSKSITLDGKVLIMRDTILRNCDYAIGIVIYTGLDTKLEMSNKSGEKQEIKISHIFNEVNTYQKYLIGLQFTLCALYGVVESIYASNDRSRWYIGVASDNSFKTFIYGVFGWFQVLSQIVPISLVVCSEIIKYLTSSFIEWDPKLRDDNLNKTVKVNRSTIHEDLGMVGIIFSDKTGTLTQNKMEFRYLEILVPGQGETFEEKTLTFGSSETAIYKRVEERRSAQSRSARQNRTKTETKNWTSLESSLKIKTSQFSNEQQQKIHEILRSDTPSAETLRLFMNHMALSNTVKPFIDETDDNKLKFQSESAEEDAMVRFAQLIGFTKKKQNPTILEEKNNTKGVPVQTEYKHLATLGFTSKRARATLIYQKQANSNKIQVMTKGQDTVILPLVRNLNDLEKSKIETKLSALYARGMRSLVCCYAELNLSWWNKWQQEYVEIISSNTIEGNKQKQHDLFEKIEVDANLKYLGIMGLEDQLQALAPEFISDCFKAKTKVWMITGDKLEAAKSIGIACNLIDPEMIRDDTSRSMNTPPRLIEVTGRWSMWVEQENELDLFFDLIVKNAKSTTTTTTTTITITTTPTTTEIIEKTINEKLGIMNAPKVIQSKFNKSSEQKISKYEFKKRVRLTKKDLSKLKCLTMEIEDGWDHYEELNKNGESDETEISLIVNRDAFITLYPELDKEQKLAEEEEKGLEKLRDKFFGLAMKSRSVIFSRALPAMKKKVVVEMRERNPDLITLAVGDGANDTDMILAAHVGIGISGVEGTAAVNASDYALPSFRMMHPLIFVHGFWSYRRISYLINFICYKTLYFTTPMVLYASVSLFSPLRRWDTVNNGLFNLLYTSAPCMALSLMDQVLPRQQLQDNPSIFSSQKRKLFNGIKFMQWLARAVVHGAWLWIVSLGSFRCNTIDHFGHTQGHAFFDLTMFISVVITVICLGIFDVNSINYLYLSAILGSYMSLIIVSVSLSYGLASYETFGIVAQMVTNVHWWLVIILAISGPLLIELIVKSYNVMMDRTLIQKHRMELYSTTNAVPLSSKIRKTIGIDQIDPPNIINALNNRFRRLGEGIAHRRDSYISKRSFDSTKFQTHDRPVDDDA